MKTTLLILLALLSNSMFGQIAWINEFHYANAWVNVNECIEVVVRDVGEYDLALFNIDLYDGRTGKTYLSRSLSEFTEGDTVADCIIYSLSFEGDTIRNGNGGIALSYDSLVVDGMAAYSQFISYGGIILAIDGPAKGLISSDVYTVENTTTSAETSIQLSGQHFIWYGFTWSVGPLSKGTENVNQVIEEAPMKLIFLTDTID